MKKFVIIGATSCIAQQCARIWVHTPIKLILVGRHAQRLKRVQADLKTRSPQSEIDILVSNLNDVQNIQESVQHIIADEKKIDQVLIAQGSLPTQTQCQEDLSACYDALKINAISPVLYAEAFATHMQRADHGSIAIIGSVAGDRGRQSNYAYGAAKSLVNTYIQGLQHRLAHTNTHLLLIKPGPTDTPMTAHLKAQGATLHSAEAVAKDIVTAIQKRRSVCYTPRKWQFIMWIVRHLPDCLFHRLNV